MNYKLAPEINASHWLNTDQSITLASLRGKVVMIEAFQMLCPGCVSHGLPQAQRVADAFGPNKVVVLGLHTVFEHHEAQGSEQALAAFLHEYQVTFPVAIDQQPKQGRLPQTMAAYAMQGTPTLILIDRLGRLRKQRFGQQDDLTLGAEIMALMAEQSHIDSTGSDASVPGDQRCDDSGCSI